MSANSHQHHDHHHYDLTSLNKAFIWGIVLNAGFVLAEFTAGFWYNSLGLISDAGHNLGDVASLVLSMIAFRLVKVKPTVKYTYGYKKSTVLVSLLNAVILLVAVGFILGESIDKLFHPRPVDGDAVAWVAGIGVVINAVTARLFMKDKERDLNVKGAYLHMAADTLVSMGVVVSGIIIRYTGWYVMDPLIGIGIALIIVYSTWGLLSSSLRLSLDGVPKEMDYKMVGEVIASAPGVLGFHHLHIWALSTTEIALTTHVVIGDLQQMEEIKCGLKTVLGKRGITHATLEMETPGKHCSVCGENGLPVMD